MSQRTLPKNWSQLCGYLGRSSNAPDTAHQRLLNIRFDSRHLNAGDVFCALPGMSHHGVEFALAAKALGAWVVSDRSADGVDLVVTDLQARMGDLLNWFYDAPWQQIRVVGITGTNGKTSTAHYVAQWLHALGRKVALIGTVGNGLFGDLQDASHTTPDAASLYRQLAQWRDDGVDVVVMEVSSHAIHQQRIVGIGFAVVALTQVTRDHLDYHGTIEAYHAVKKQLFTQWASAVQVLNAQDAVGASLIDLCPNVRTYGTSTAHAQCTALQACAEGMQLRLRLGTATWEGLLPLYGAFNVDNVLCAVLCVQSLGYEAEQLFPLLLHTHAVVGRMQQLASSPVVVVDYAHTPDALEKALQALRDHMQQGNLWVVFGAGGDRDKGKRPLMGAVAKRLADKVIITDDNPRSEEPAQIAAEIMADDLVECATYIADRAIAICTAIAQASAQDMVLIAGKGHESYQERAGVKYPFSDAKVVAACRE